MSKEAIIAKLRQFKAEGYDTVCMGCNTVTKGAPQEWYEDGHGGRNIDMCRCGCDLFISVDEVIKKIQEGR